MQYEAINTDAIKAVLDLMVGPEMTEVIQKTYVAFDAAMSKAHSTGYAEGYEDGYDDAEEGAQIIDMANDGMLEELAYQSEKAFYEGDSGDEQPTD